jgi:hypothetical protein
MKTCKFNSHVFIPVNGIGKCAICGLGISLNKLGPYAPMVDTDFARAMVTFMVGKPFWFGSANALLGILHNINEDPFGQKILHDTWPKHYTKLKAMITAFSTSLTELGLIARTGFSLSESIKQEKKMGKYKRYVGKRYGNLTNYDITNLNRFLHDVKLIADEITGRNYIESKLLRIELKARHELWRTYTNPAGDIGTYGYNGSHKGLTARNMGYLITACKIAKAARYDTTAEPIIFIAKNGDKRIRKRQMTSYFLYSIDAAYDNYKFVNNSRISAWVELAWRYYMQSGQAYLANKIQFAE